MHSKIKIGAHKLKKIKNRMNQNDSDYHMILF